MTSGSKTARASKHPRPHPSGSRHRADGAPEAGIRDAEEGDADRGEREELRPDDIERAVGECCGLVPTPDESHRAGLDRETAWLEIPWLRPSLLAPSSECRHGR